MKNNNLKIKTKTITITQNVEVCPSCNFEHIFEVFQKTSIYQCFNCKKEKCKKCSTKYEIREILCTNSYCANYESINFLEDKYRSILNDKWGDKTICQECLQEFDNIFLDISKKEKNLIDKFDKKYDNLTKVLEKDIINLMNERMDIINSKLIKRKMK